MSIDERKRKILEALVFNYLQTGEPVGSRTISKLSDLDLSSATIRNEMADLEEMGYIIQPHTSAGRIPTDDGYRFYVNSLLNKKQETIRRQQDQLKKKNAQINDLKKRIEGNINDIDFVMQDIASILADDTEYATVVTSIRGERRIKFIQLSRLEPGRILAVLVLDGNIIRNKVFSYSGNISDESISGLNMMLNTSLAGLDILQLRKELEKAKKDDRPESLFLVRIYETVLEIFESTDDVSIYTSGTTNIFKYPELSISDTARGLISIFEKKMPLSYLASDGETKDGIRFYIGSESPIEPMKNCSVITTTYKLNDGVKGTIGIIGPKRMNYRMVVDTLANMNLRLKEIFAGELPSETDKTLKEDKNGK